MVQPALADATRSAKFLWCGRRWTFGPPSSQSLGSFNVLRRISRFKMSWHRSQNIFELVWSEKPRIDWQDDKVLHAPEFELWRLWLQHWRGTGAKRYWPIRFGYCLIWLPPTKEGLHCYCLSIFYHARTIRRVTGIYCKSKNLWIMTKALLAILWDEPQLQEQHIELCTMIRKKR